MFFRIMKFEIIWFINDNIINKKTIGGSKYS